MRVWGHHKMGQKGKADTASLNDYWHLGSNTKALTGLIAARLVEQGRLSWDTRLLELFPEWEPDIVLAYNQVTLKNLLSHRAGIRPYTSGLEKMAVPKMEGSIAEKRTAFVKYVLTQQPIKTGLQFAYSNAGYAVAAAMLERATGKTWEQLVEEQINKPLNLNAGFGWPNLTDEHQPWGHWENMGKVLPVGPDVDYDLSLMEPAGDIKMTLPDYVKLIQANLKGLKGDESYLKKDTWQFLHSGVEGYAIGWSHQEKDGKQYSEHLGSAGTFLCYVLIDVTKGKACIVMTNEGTDEAQKYLMETRNKLIAGKL